MSNIINIEDAVNNWVKIKNEDIVKISNELFVAIKLNYHGDCITCDLYPGEGNNCLLNKKYINKSTYKNMSCAKLLRDKILLKGGV